MVMTIATPLEGTRTETAVSVSRESCGAVTLPEFVMLMFLSCKGENKKTCVLKFVVLKYFYIGNIGNLVGILTVC